MTPVGRVSLATLHGLGLSGSCLLLLALGYAEPCLLHRGTSKLAKQKKPHRSIVAMLPIKGLYEIAIRVQDLARAESFTKMCSG